MADAGDLKSPVVTPRAGSNPAPGTTVFLTPAGLWSEALCRGLREPREATPGPGARPLLVTEVGERLGPAFPAPTR